MSGDGIVWILSVKDRRQGDGFCCCDCGRGWPPLSPPAAFWWKGTFRGAFRKFIRGFKREDQGQMAVQV